MTAQPDYDVLIVGGGPVGLALALALRGSGLTTALVETRAALSVQADPRPIAVSYGSRLILERLGAWEELAQASPIRRIHVSQRGGFGRVELDCAQAGLPALGYVVDYGRLAGSLTDAFARDAGCARLSASVVGIETEAVAAKTVLEAATDGRINASARLLAVADGGMLQVAVAQGRDYGQAAVTARVTTGLPQQGVAYERFTPAGPLALLPFEQGYAVVWTTRPEEARTLCDLSEAAFLERLQAAFGHRAGAFTAVSTRACFPLALRVAEGGGPRTVTLGNAAQTLHPVAGQGLNLGLRDAWELAGMLRATDRSEVGTPRQLQAYQARRRIDRRGGVWFTDTLVRLFSNDVAPLRFARGLGLAVLGAVPPARDFVLRRMTFGTRG
jgi:2-octaprenyl-6-methoxyphenol hydroxylase